MFLTTNDYKRSDLNDKICCSRQILRFTRDECPGHSAAWSLVAASAGYMAGTFVRSGKCVTEKIVS